MQRGGDAIGPRQPLPRGQPAVAGRPGRRAVVRRQRNSHPAATQPCLLMHTCMIPYARGWRRRMQHHAAPAWAKPSACAAAGSTFALPDQNRAIPALLSEHCYLGRPEISPCSTRGGGDGVDALHRELWHRHCCHRVTSGARSQLQGLSASRAACSAPAALRAAPCCQAAELERSVGAPVEPALCCTRQVLCCYAAGCPPARLGCATCTGFIRFSVGIRKATIQCSTADMQHEQAAAASGKPCRVAHTPSDCFTA